MSEVPTSHTLLRFGVFELDTESGELRKHGVKIKLQEQPFQILQLLLEHPGKVVTHEELQKRIWPSDTFVDFDRGLYNAIKKLRESLDDSAESPRFIETLSRRGYRFIAEVTKNGGVSGPTEQASIAMLPFINMSPDAENEFFADGITEEIINVLSQIEGLHVAARTSSFFFKGKHPEIRQIGEQLNVRTVLEGSVRKVGDRLRITAQLVNVADGYHLSSERYDRELKDIFEIQDEIARSIASRLKLTLEAKSHEVLVKPGTKNLEAYTLYVKGRALIYRRGGMIPLALECLKQAVDLDPGYALAWAGMADVYTLLAFYGFIHPEICRPRWLEAAHRAVAADSSLAESHTALAFGSLMFDLDRSQAEREFLHALDLNPVYIQARDWYACFYLQIAMGQLTEGITHGVSAVQADPLSAYANGILGLLYGAAGKYPEGLQYARRAVELDGESLLPRWALQMVLYFCGRFEESVAAAEDALRVSGRHPWAMAVLALTLHECGKQREANAIYEELLARANREYVQPATLAGCALAAGQLDQAINYALEAAAIRDPYRVAFSTYWPVGMRYRDRLCAYPRFRELLSEMGFE